MHRLGSDADDAGSRADASVQQHDRPRETEAAVRVRGLTKRFGAKAAIDDVSLTVDSGTAYGLIGPNGAGKTTTFSLMAGYLHPTAGSVEVLGHSPADADQLRSRIGVLPQDAILPASDKVGELLVHMARLQNIPPRKVRDAARAALNEVEGPDWWNQRCGSLSHGMAKRVALAQAFLGDPEVLLLDEPTAGLDPRTAWAVRQLIVARKGRCTIVISSHNLQELEEICEAAAILDRGRVVASGTMAELTATNEEIHVRVAPGTKRGSQSAQVNMSRLRELPMIERCEFDEERGDIAVYFERRRTDADTVIGQVLSTLLTNQVRITGVSKGRGLEKRVMDLT